MVVARALLLPMLFTPYELHTELLASSLLPLSRHRHQLVTCTYCTMQGHVTSPRVIHYIVSKYSASPSRS